MPFSFHLEYVVREPATLALPGLGLVYRLGGRRTGSKSRSDEWSTIRPR